MWRFFSKRNHIRFIGVTSIIIPIISTIVAFQQREKVLGGICVTWLIDTCIALTAGYYIRAERPCHLKHFPENIGIEQSQLPNLTETVEIEPSQIEGTQTIQMTSRISLRNS